MRLEFQLPQGPVNLFLDVLDNPGAQAWANHFGHAYETTAHICDHTYVETLNKEDELAGAYQSILRVLDQLKYMGLEYPAATPEPFIETTAEQCHKDLNLLHRFFTTQQQRCNLNHYGKDFDHVQATVFLQQLNDLVHYAEGFISRGHSDCPVNSMREIKLYRPTHSGDPVWLDMSAYQQYHSADYYDVVLTSEILGKTLLQSYLDNDDPDHWDTSGHYVSAGGLQICLSGTRQKIYQSASFHRWITSYHVDPQQAVYDFPIGNISNKHSQEWNQVLDYLRDGINHATVTYYL